MKNSKIIAASAIATVMTASSAYAELSVGGGMAGWFESGDNVTSAQRTWNTGSVNVSYSATLDNGMGLSVNANVGDTSNYTAAGVGTGTTTTGNSGGANYNMSISSDMGTITFGDQIASANDYMDNKVQSGSLFACCTASNGAPNAILGYNDADGAQGNDGIVYTSPSISGWTVRASHGLTANQVETGGDDTNSVAAVGSVAGISLGLGMATIGEQGAAGEVDSTFAQAGMSFGDISVAYGMYSTDGSGDGTMLTVDMPLMGMSSKVTFADFDAEAGGTDADGYQIGLMKSLGAASFGIEFAHSEAGSGADNETETWKLGYQVYF